MLQPLTTEASLADCLYPNSNQLPLQQANLLEADLYNSMFNGDLFLVLIVIIITMVMLMIIIMIIISTVLVIVATAATGSLALIHKQL